MDAQTITARIARRVASAIAQAGATPATVAEATDMALPDLELSLLARRDFQATELCHIGGFLHIAPEHLLGAAR